MKNDLRKRLSEELEKFITKEDKLALVHELVEGHLNQLAAALPSHYKLTFLARHESNPKAHFMLTLDSVDVLNQTLRELGEMYEVHSGSGTKKTRT